MNTNKQSDKEATTLEQGLEGSTGKRSFCPDGVRVCHQYVEIYTNQDTLLCLGIRAFYYIGVFD